MKLIEGNYNPELMGILDEFTEWFFEQDLSQLKFRGVPDSDDHFVSADYLKKMQARDHEIDTKAIGFPTEVYGIDMMMQQVPEHLRKRVNKVNIDLNSWFGSKFCAVQMYYPKGGFMDWHNNANCPGYNILFSYNREGDGFFRYQDPITKKIVTMQDPVGWSAKVGYYGSWNEPDKIYWHCAKSNSDRLTFGYVIPDFNMWQMMIDDIRDA